LVKGSVSVPHLDGLISSLIAYFTGLLRALGGWQKPIAPSGLLHGF